MKFQNLPSKKKSRGNGRAEGATAARGNVRENRWAETELHRRRKGDPKKGRYGGSITAQKGSILTDDTLAGLCLPSRATGSLQFFFKPAMASFISLKWVSGLPASV